MLHLLASLVFTAGLSTATVDSVELRRESLMEALQKGGYTILLRHARTDRAFNEQRDPMPTERSQQRNLTDDGVKDAKLMGVVFRKYHIPLGEIISSPMYRTLETAEMAAGKPTHVTMALRVFPPTPDQAKLVMTPPKKGTNRLLVTHHFVIETHVPGINPGDVGESEAAVVRHTADGKVELVGRITLDDWSALADPASARPIEPRQLEGNGGGVHGGLVQLLHGSPEKSYKETSEVPDTHAGHIAKEYIAAFNTGSADKMKAFLDNWMVANPSRPMEERLKTYASLFQEHGALTVINVQKAEALEVILGMKSRVGDFRLTVKSSDADPMKGASIGFAMLGQHR